MGTAETGTQIRTDGSFSEAILPRQHGGAYSSQAYLAALFGLSQAGSAANLGAVVTGQSIFTPDPGPLSVTGEGLPDEVHETEELSRPILLGEASTEGASNASGWVVSDPRLVTSDEPDRMTLRESPNTLETTAYQDFVIPAGAKRLAFTISGLTYDSLLRAASTPDAFGVALLDPVTHDPLVPVDTLTDVYFISDLIAGGDRQELVRGVTVQAWGPEGSLRVVLNVEALGGREARLFFRLLGGSDASQLGGSVTISDILVSRHVSPVATFSNSGSVEEGSAATVLFSDATGGADAGFTYSYDFDNDGVFDMSGSSATALIPARFLDDGPNILVIHGRIANDIGYSDYTTTIQVRNVAHTDDPRSIRCRPRKEPGWTSLQSRPTRAARIRRWDSPSLGPSQRTVPRSPPAMEPISTSRRPTTARIS